MRQILLSCIQIAISIWELWMLYELLYTTVLNKEYATKTEKVVGWCNILLAGVVMGVNRINFFFSSPIFIATVVLTIICMLAINRKKILLLIGMGLSYFALVALLDFVYAFICIEFLGERFKEDIYITYVMSWQKVMIFFLSRGVFWGLIVFLKRKGINIRNVLEQSRGFMILIGFLLCVLLLKYQYELYDMVYGLQPIQGFGAGAGLLMICFVVILIGWFIAKYQLMKQEQATLVLRDRLLEERYAEMLKSRQLIHDMKNHLLALQTMEKESRWEELHDYLEEISRDVYSDVAKCWTGNSMIDLILNSKKRQANLGQIDFYIEANVVGEIPLTYRETISLFGNLLDNAIEACEQVQTGKKWIDLKIRKQQGLFYIEVENSMERRPEERKNQLISRKKDSGVHGYGLKNVRQIVDKYDGTYFYEIREKSFITIISFFTTI